MQRQKSFLLSDKHLKAVNRGAVPLIPDPSPLPLPTIDLSGPPAAGKRSYMVRFTLISRVHDCLPLAEGLDSEKDGEIDQYKAQAKVS